VKRATEHVFLIHGSDSVRVYQERARLVAETLPREHRAANLTEIEPPGNRPLQLSRIAAALMEELSTPSFFPDVPRVVVVEQLAELLENPKRGRGGRKASAKGKKSKAPTADEAAMKAFCRYLERELPQVGNVLILSVIEDPDKWRRVQTSSPLFKAVRAVGRVVEFKQPPAIFSLIDAFSTRDLGSALRVLPEILKQDDGPGTVFRMLTRQVRFLIQAKLLDRFGSNPEEAKAFSEQNFPPAKGLNLMLEHSFTIEKARRASKRWSFTDLNALYPQLERLSKVIYPSLNDVYVPDPEMELERLILQSCRSSAPTTAKPY